jgi:hypothetical protein
MRNHSMKKVNCIIFFDSNNIDISHCNYTIIIRSVPVCTHSTDISLYGGMIKFALFKYDPVFRGFSPKDLHRS